PAAGAPAAGGNGADGDPATRAGGAGEESGNADGMLAAGLLAGLGGGAAIGWLVSRWRRRGPDEATALAEVTGDPDRDSKRDEAATLAEITGRAQPAATRGSGNDATTPAETTSQPAGTAGTTSQPAGTAEPADPARPDPQHADPQHAVSAASR
ncbi:hypothetical protein ACWCOX_31255, partial [Micromonospora parva]